jgi:hypothetical protein
VEKLLAYLGCPCRYEILGVSCMKIKRIR